MLKDAVAVGVPSVDAIGEGSGRQCRSRLKAHRGRLELDTIAISLCLSRSQRQGILRKNVNYLTVRLHRVGRSSSHVAHPRPLQQMGSPCAAPSNSPLDWLLRSESHSSAWAQSAL